MRSDTRPPSSKGAARDRTVGVSRTRRVARWLGFAAAAIGALALIGWVADVGLLKSVVPGNVAMKPNAAIGLILLGAALSLVTSSRAAAARLSGGFALLAATIGAATLMEIVTGLDFGIDQLLFREAPGAVWTATLGQMSPETAVCLVLLGLALPLLRHDRSIVLAQVLATLVGLVAVFELLGLALGAKGASPEWPFTLMPFPTATAVLLLAVGTLFTRADLGFMTVATADTAAGQFVRRIVPITAVLMLAIAEANNLGEEAGIFGHDIRAAVSMTVATAAVAVATWIVAATLHAREMTLRASQRAGGIGSYELDIAAGTWSCTQVLDEILGIDATDPRTLESWAAVLHPDDRDEMLRYFREHVLGQRLPFDRDYRIIRKSDGQERWISGRGELTMGESGDPMTMVGTIQDITERRRAEAMLQEAESRLGAVLSSAPITILATDSQGVFTLSEGKGLERVGLEPGANVGVSAIDVWGSLPFVEPTGEVITGKDVVDRALAGETVNAVSELRGVYFDNHIGPLRDADGEVVGIVGVAADITEQKLAAEEIRELNRTLEARVEERTRQLTEVNRELESFSSSVSHDLRAPLRSIDGFANILEEDYGQQLDEQGRHYLEVIRSSVGSMGDLIDSLLRFSRLGRESLHLGAADPAAIAREIVAGDLQRQLQDHSVEVTIGDVPTCRADRDMIKIVLSNLLGNAVKFTAKRDHAVVEFGATRKDGEIAYFLRDNGAGFDMRYAGKLFGVFERLHNASEFEGTGVGLAIAQRVIHRHGGRIWADSQVGKGATFYFTIGEAP